jgi:hypothetical protein
VDRYRLSKKGKLSASTINITLSTLSAILELAVEYGQVPALGSPRPTSA